MMHCDPQGRPSGRTRGQGVLVLLVFLLAAGGGAAVVWPRVGHSAASELVGAAPVIPPMRAYGFRLTDQAGRTVSLAGLRGKAVALTFLYTHCPDVCPLIADKLHETYVLLGKDAGRVALLAVSVDPRGDTPAMVRYFLTEHHVVHELAYLTGSFQQLKPVWAHYYIGTDAKEVNPNAVAESAPSPAAVTHTALVYVIDFQGRIRLFLPANFAPQDLATDLRLLSSGAVR